MEANNVEILLTTGGAGTTSSAASRSKANRSALNSQKTPYGKGIVGLKEDIKLAFVKPSEEELKKVKSQINTTEKRIRKKEIVIFIVALLIFSTFVYFFF